MSKIYAKGSKAWGICQRSGMRCLARELVEDGRVPGLLVHPSWREPFQPQEREIDVSDPVALRRPSPQVDIEPGYLVAAPDLSTLIPL